MRYSTVNDSNTAESRIDELAVDPLDAIFLRSNIRCLERIEAWREWRFYRWQEVDVVAEWDVEVRE